MIKMEAPLEPPMVISQHHVSLSSNHTDISPKVDRSLQLKPVQRHPHPSHLRILKERSSNSRNESFSEEDRHQQNLEPSSATSSVENEFQQRMVTGYVASQPEASIRRKSEAEIDKDLRGLLYHLGRCDTFKEYRKNQHETTGKTAKHGKWPDSLEKAFLRALVKWEPMGRRKIFEGPKQMGRNELIAQSLKEWTGENIKRKQVSSHLQVLKDKVRGKPYSPNILYWLEGDNVSRRAEKLQRRNQIRSMGYAPDRRSRHGKGYSLSGQPQLPDPTNMVPSNAPPRHQSVLEPFVFDMYIQVPPKKGEEKGKRVHTYTRMCSLPRSDLHLDEIQNWRKKFPFLHDLHRSDKIDCDIIYGHASIALTSQPLNDMEMAIKFDIASQRDLATTHNWDCRSYFYECGELVQQIPEPREFPENSEEEDGFESNSASNITHFDANTRWEHTVPFGSSWWAAKFGKLASYLSKATKNAEKYRIGSDEQGAAAQNLRTVQGAVRNHIADITAVQVISAVPKMPLEPTKRIAIICWSFRQADHGVSTGSTRFRNILPQLSKEGKPLYNTNDLPWGDFGLELQEFQDSAAASSGQYEYGLDDLSTMALAGIPQNSANSHLHDSVLGQAGSRLDQIPENGELGIHLGLSMTTSMPSFSTSDHQHDPHDYSQQSFSQEEQIAPIASQPYNSNNTYDPYQHQYQHHPQASQLSWANYNQMFPDPGMAYHHTSTPTTYNLPAIYDFQNVQQHESQARYENAVTPRSQRHHEATHLVLPSQNQEYYQQYLPPQSQAKYFSPGRPNENRHVVEPRSASSVGRQEQQRDTSSAALYSPTYLREQQQHHDVRLQQHQHQHHHMPHLLPSAIEK